jgi:hypothetical protein
MLVNVLKFVEDEGGAEAITLALEICRVIQERQLPLVTAP